MIVDFLLDCVLKDRGNQEQTMGPRTGQEGDSKREEPQTSSKEETRTVLENGSGSNRELLTSLSALCL